LTVHNILSNVPEDEAARFGTGATALLQRSDFQTLIDALVHAGYAVIGPRVHNGAVVYDNVETVEDLPEGIGDAQEGGRYRLVPRGGAALFGYTSGAQSWRRRLFPPRQRIWRAERTEDGFKVDAEPPDLAKMAFLGVRSCELHAIAIQDRVFLNGDCVDPGYKARRENTLIIAVNCTRAGGTCFCLSMETGPKAHRGFDLALTELLDEERHAFLVEVGSETGADVARALPLQPASDADRQQAEELLDRTARSMGRRLETDQLKQLLQGNLEHPRWQEVAERCLACGNCTLVCPTCFCFAVDDSTDLSGQTAERHQRWDSCFTLGHSYIHGGSVRGEIRSRYRQWMTHKLAHWLDQFGVSGCVGCGRCITWCPVGIDITEEVAAIRAGGWRP
jgi:ferredoxin